MINRNSVCRMIVLTIILIPLFTHAQSTKKKRKGEFYFSWGYNKEWYTNSNVSVSQPSLGNSFTFVNVKGADHPGWDEQFFTKAISIPQYNYRLGYIFNSDKGLGFEINFDHTKWIFGNNQMVHVKGKINNHPYDGQVLFADSVAGSDSSSYHYLNNGANFLLFNIVKRWHIYANKKQTILFDGFGKFGVGPLIPHVQVKYFDQPQNDPHFQIGGWNVGAEAALRATLSHYLFLEYTHKLDYARYNNLKIYQGTAK
ncbi:MAG: hypothetical protein M3N30_09755, partial [Bacteroidota bacterium]|nr:hypothetical protein [Bacteroidota bacterium]